MFKGQRWIKTGAAILSLGIAGSFANAQQITIQDVRFGFDRPAVNQAVQAPASIRFSGTVTGRQVVPSADGNMVQLVVKSPNGGTSVVEVGPEWFIERYGSPIRVKDNITVVGNKVFIRNDSVVIAQQIIRGDQILALRDERGIPFWPQNQQAPALNDPRIVEGVVREFTILPARVMGAELGMWMDTEIGLVRVHLGPISYLSRENLTLNVGDEIRLMGVTVPSRSGVTLAAAIQTVDGVWYIRNEDGTPFNNWGLGVGTYPFADVRMRGEPANFTVPQFRGLPFRSSIG